MTTSWFRSPHVVRASWAAWGLLFLIMAGMVLSGGDRTVTDNYWQAGASWLAGRPLYAQTGHGFIYLPQAAIVFAPFSALPPLTADVLWRLLAIGAYAYSIRRLARLCDNDSGIELFPLMTALCLPLAWDSARNGQATLLVTAMMIRAAVDLAGQRWTRAALWLCLGVAVKPLGTFLLLLAAVLYRPVRGRLLAALALVAVIPFLMQRPDYVISQYRAWAGMAAIGANVGPAEEWAQLFGMLSIAGLRLSAVVQTEMRAAAAILTLGVCLVAVRRQPSTQAAVLLFVVHACFLMLFSPRTENNTYAVLAPAIAVLCAQAWLIERRWVAGVALTALAVTTAGGYELGRRLLPGSPPNWLAPLMAVGFTVYAISRIWSGVRSPANHHGVAEPVSGRSRE